MSLYTPKTWVARAGTGLNKYSISGATAVPLVNVPDSVTTTGDAFSTENMNGLESRISAGLTNAIRHYCSFSVSSPSSWTSGSGVTGYAYYKDFPVPASWYDFDNGVPAAFDISASWSSGSMAAVILPYYPITKMPVVDEARIRCYSSSNNSSATYSVTFYASLYTEADA